jgi:hypothetical protein
VEPSNGPLSALKEPGRKLRQRCFFRPAPLLAREPVLIAKVCQDTADKRFSIQEIIREEQEQVGLRTPVDVAQDLQGDCQIVALFDERSKLLSEAVEQISHIGS